MKRIWTKKEQGEMRRSNELGNLIRNFKILNLKIFNLLLKFLN